MTYETDPNTTAGKVFILKGDEIADFGLAKQEQLLELMAEVSSLNPDASASQVVEFAKQRLLTRNVLSTYQEISAPPLPSLLELTAGDSATTHEEEVAEDELSADEAEEEVTDEDSAYVEEAPEVEELEEEPVAEDGTQGEIEDPEEAEYILDEETEDYVEEQGTGDEPAGVAAEGAAVTYPGTEESSEEEAQAVEPDATQGLTTSYDSSAPIASKQSRRYVGLLDAAARLDVRND